MKDQLLALYELQAIDIKLAQLNSRLAALGGAKDLRRQYAAAKTVLDAAEKSLSGNETELLDLELKLKSIDEKRVNFEKRLYSGSISSPKELSATEKEIQMLKDQQGKLDSRTLELYDIVERARAEAQEARAKVADIEKQYRQAMAAEAVEKTQIEAELAELASQRDAAAAKVADKALLSRYEVVRKRSGGTAIAKVVEGRCEACRVSITSFTTRKLFEAKEIISCENCGHILVLDPK